MAARGGLLSRRVSGGVRGHTSKGKLMREEKESTLHPGMGVYALCMGPNSPMPGERLQIVIYNQADEVVRRFEQIRGACLVEGYATFFANDPRAASGLPLAARRH